MKGKEVKSFAAYVPQPDLTKVRARVAVRFHATTGDFEILLPNHIALAVDGHSATNRHFYSSFGSVRAQTLEEVERAYATCCAAYEEILRTEQRHKVILVSYRRNRIHDEQMHFALTPSIGLEYEVLWQAGNRLYRQIDIDFPLVDAGTSEDQHEGRYVIEWTPEREAFIEVLHRSLCGLIERLDVFMQDATANVDLAIASGIMPLLLGPSQED